MAWERSLHERWRVYRKEDWKGQKESKGILKRRAKNRFYMDVQC